MVEINNEYLRRLYGDEHWKKLTPKLIRRIKRTMGKYDDNRWWESNDPIRVASNQAFENIWIAKDHYVYHEGLQKILGRPVLSCEGELNRKQFREEVRIGIERYKKSIGVSREYQETATRKAIELLEKACKKAGVPLLNLSLDESSKNDQDGIDRSGEDGWLN